MAFFSLLQLSAINNPSYIFSAHNGLGISGAGHLKKLHFAKKTDTFRVRLDAQVIRCFINKLYKKFNV